LVWTAVKSHYSVTTPETKPEIWVNPWVRAAYVSAGPVEKVRPGRGQLFAALIVLAVVISRPAFAQSEDETAEPPPEPFQTEIPIDCPEGETCWIVNHVDRDRSRSALDYKCGHVTKDRQRGTDFAIGSEKAIRRGIPVLASAPGVIVGVRNTEDDNFSGTQDKPPTGKLNCGNGVMIEHQEGWTTQYCHLRKGSVTAKKDQEVTGGQVIGAVGLSGKTDFPHLSFTVRHKKTIVDSFIGLEPSNECSLGAQQLWKSPNDPILSYRGPEIERGGFSDIRPNKEGSPPQNDARPVISRQTRAIYLWSDFIGLRPDDEIWFRVFAPAGDQIMEHSLSIKRHHFSKRIFVEFQKRWILWPDGEYRGTVTLRRHQGNDVKDYPVEHSVEMR